MDTNRGGQVLTFDSISSQYPEKDYILLMPQVSRHLLTTIPMWSLDVAEVKVDPRNNAHAYEIGYNSGEFGLTKVSLDALATAADLTVMARRVDDRHDRSYAEYEGVAIMTTPSGGVRSQGRTCEWVAEVEKGKIIMQAERWVDNSIRKGWSGCNANNRDEKLAQRINEGWLRAQEFGKRMVESKAGNRAVRALLGISPKYSFDDLDKKKFAVVRFVFTPDLEDREIKLMVIGAGLQAQRMLYGAPVEQIVTATALPAIEQVQGEIPQLPAGEQEAPAQIEGPQDVEVVEDEPGDNWSEAIALIPEVLAKIETVGDDKIKRQLRNRITKAITNQDAAQVNGAMDYIMSMEGK